LRIWKQERQNSINPLKKGPENDSEKCWRKSEKLDGFIEGIKKRGG
jgi:hypothetical protein